MIESLKILIIAIQRTNFPASMITHLYESYLIYKFF